jgi:hypothetical protein
MTRRLLFAVSLVAFLVPAASAQALTLATFNACAGGSPPLGIADRIDGTGGNAIGAGSGAPYNLDPSDDAAVCVDQHYPGGSVDTAAEFANEIANTTSHELGHLLGLEHVDGTAASLMNGSFSGTDKGFSTAAEQAVLNAQPAIVQVVFLDFGLASTEIPFGHNYVPFAQSATLAQYGIVGAAAIQAIVNAIIANVVADFAGPWTSGTTYDFQLTENDALQAALQSNGNLDYSTVVFLALPEPGSAPLLLSAGALVARVAARSRRRRV